MLPLAQYLRVFSNLFYRAASCWRQVRYLDGTWMSAEYWTFLIGSNATSYLLNVSGFSGDAGDAMAGCPFEYNNSNGKPFSTYDQDNDNSFVNMARDFKSGWWYDTSSMSKLNIDAYGSWCQFTVIKDSRMMIQLVQ